MKFATRFWLRAFCIRIWPNFGRIIYSARKATIPPYSVSFGSKGHVISDVTAYNVSPSRCRIVFETLTRYPFRPTVNQTNDETTLREALPLYCLLPSLLNIFLNVSEQIFLTSPTHSLIYLHLDNSGDFHSTVGFCWKGYYVSGKARNANSLFCLWKV